VSVHRVRSLNYRSPSGLNVADSAKVSVHSSFAGLLNYQIVNVLELVAAEIVIKTVSGRIII